MAKRPFAGVAASADLPSRWGVSALSRLVPMPHDAREGGRGGGVDLVEVGGGWQFRTALDLAPELATVMRKPRRLPRAAMEMLAIVAQYQPVTRAEIEQIRGASLSQASIDLLLEEGLIEPKGTKNAPGRPALWLATPAFLAHFFLASIRELPGVELLNSEP